VTVDQLLQHRSGVAPLTLITPTMMATVGAAKNARDLLPLITSTPLSFHPGERQEYSNGGYFLLGVVIEEVSGKDYGVYLRDAIFVPLGMTSTSLAADAATAIRMTKMLLGSAPLATPRPLVGGPDFAGNPAGDGVSNASDMLRLGRSLVGDRLLTRSTKEKLFPHPTGPWRLGQSGGSIGVNTDFAVYPDTGWVVVTLSNTDPPAGELMGEVMRTLTSSQLCQPLAPKDRPSPFQIMTAPPR